MIPLQRSIESDWNHTNFIPGTRTVLFVSLASDAECFAQSLRECIAPLIVPCIFEKLLPRLLVLPRTMASKKNDPNQMTRPGFGMIAVDTPSTIIFHFDITSLRQLLAFLHRTSMAAFESWSICPKRWTLHGAKSFYQTNAMTYLSKIDDLW